MGPLKRYQEAFSAGRYIPTLQVSNYMNREAIVQVTLSPALLLPVYGSQWPCIELWPSTSSFASITMASGLVVGNDEHR